MELRWAWARRVVVALMSAGAGALALALGGEPLWTASLVVITAFAIGSCWFAAEWPARGLQQADVPVCELFDSDRNGPQSVAGSARQELPRLPVVPIASIHDGQEARFVGQLRLIAGQGLTAPLSGRRCAFYKARVQAPVLPRLFPGAGQRWHTVAQETQSRHFYVEDPTGRALVAVERPRALLSMRGHFVRDRTHRLRLQAFVAKHARHHDGTSVRCEEGVLQEGDPVVIQGRCQWVPDADPEAPGGHYRHRPARLVVKAPVYVSDGTALLDA